MSNEVQSSIVGMLVMFMAALCCKLWGFQHVPTIRSPVTAPWAFSGLHDRKQNVGRGHVGDQRLPGTDGRAM